MVLQAAARKHYLPDPTAGVKPLPLPQREHENFLTPEELHTFLNAAKRLYPQWHTFIVLGFTLRMRPGELRPLRWDEDDLPALMDPLLKNTLQVDLDPPTAKTTLDDLIATQDKASSEVHLRVFQYIEMPIQYVLNEMAKQLQKEGQLAQHDVDVRRHDDPGVVPFQPGKAP